MTNRPALIALALHIFTLIFMAIGVTPWLTMTATALWLALAVIDELSGAGR